MKKWVLVVALLVFSGGAWAEDAPPAPSKSTTIGGGVNNPWRSPYRIALTVAHPADAR